MIMAEGWMKAVVVMVVDCARVGLVMVVVGSLKVVVEMAVGWMKVVEMIISSVVVVMVMLVEGTGAD